MQSCLQKQQTIQLRCVRFKPPRRSQHRARQKLPKSPSELQACSTEVRLQVLQSSAPTTAHTMRGLHLHDIPRPVGKASTAGRRVGEWEGGKGGGGALYEGHLCPVIVPSSGSQDPGVPAVPISVALSHHVEEHVGCVRPPHYGCSFPAGIEASLPTQEARTFYTEVKLCLG